MSFINPLFLAALGTALLPVLYHLVRRMRAKKVEFSSLMFLRATPKELVRRRRLRDWLLLALRSLMFALLALAFARPFLPQETIPFAEQVDNQSTVILLDNSYSMQYDDVFETARSEALDRISSASANDEFAVLTFSNTINQLTSLDTDHSAHRSALQNTAAVSYRPTNFHEPLRLGEELLQEARHTRRRIVLISDFQDGGWPRSMDSWKLNSNIEFIPVKVGPSDPENTYIEGVELTQKRRGQQVLVQYGARVLQQPPAANGRPMVRLSVDGEAVDERAVSSSEGAVKFQQLASEAGFFQGTIAAGDSDRLAVDDEYYFTYVVDPQSSILCIDGALSEPRSDAFFLQKAFDMGNDALFQFSTGSTERLNTGSLDQYEMIFLANVPRLTAQQATRLEQYVEAGGTVLISFGDQTDTANLSAALQMLEIGRLQAPEPESLSPAQETFIGEINLKHPVFSIFAEAGGSPIFRPKFRRYVPLEPDSTAQVLGTFSSGDPFLVEQTAGSGRILVYTSSFSTAWTDFPIDEAYVPLLYQLAKYGTRRAGQQYIYTVGDRIPLTGAPDDEWEVRAPDEKLYSVTVDSSGKGFFGDTQIPGHYVAAQNGEQVRFSVNLDTRESNLESRDQEEAYAAIVPSTEQKQSVRTQNAATVSVAEEEQQQKLWRPILLVVIGILALETILANRRLGMRSNAS